jgi:predicted GH43/DUF377 family glycosyl hydrolase
MKWIKKGQIFEPIGQYDWMMKYGILPTPFFIRDKNIIRIFFATSAEDNIGRITYMDVDADNPSTIIAQPSKIIFPEGEDGCFDDCGVNPNQVFFIDGKPYMIYNGYERTYKLPYRILSGIAEMNDSLTEIFNRWKAPILDRTNDELFIRSNMMVVQANGLYHFWYVSAFGWGIVPGNIHQNKMLPEYCIKHGTTSDFRNFNITPQPSIKKESEYEFGFARPWVMYEDGVFKMWYSVRRSDVPYRLGYAESNDGINWTRLDNLEGLNVSDTGWDSEMVCYATVVKTDSKTYLFYNGNNNGAAGFGYAELDNQ